jgi:hypothetical protein
VNSAWIGKFVRISARLGAAMASAAGATNATTNDTTVTAAARDLERALRDE